MQAWKIFTNKETGKELMAYTLYGEAYDEEEATKELLAYENGIDVSAIATRIEER